MTIHDFDIVRHFLGDIDSIHATTQHTDPDIAAAGDPDGAMVVLTAASGAIATIINNRRNAFGYDQRIEAFGRAGVLSVGNPTETTVTVADVAASSSRGRILTSYRDRYAAAYRAEIAHLAEVVLDGVSSRSTLLDGVRPIRTPRQSCGAHSAVRSLVRWASAGPSALRSGERTSRNPASASHVPVRSRPSC